LLCIADIVIIDVYRLNVVFII